MDGSCKSCTKLELVEVVVCVCVGGGGGGGDGGAGDGDGSELFSTAIPTQQAVVELGNSVVPKSDHQSSSLVAMHC